MASAVHLAVLLVSAAVAVTGGGPASAPATATSAQPAKQSFPLYLSADRALVMMRVGEHAPFPVVFDTGTSGNLLDLSLADKLGLPDTGRSDAKDGQGNAVPGHQTRLSGASIGGVALPAGDATAAPYDLPDEVGVVGPNSFTGRFVEVDPAKGVVTLLGRTEANTPRCAAFTYSNAFSFDNSESDTLPAAVLDIAGLSLVAEVDTGNNAGVILPTSYIPRLTFETKPVPVGDMQSAAGREPVLKGRLATDVSVAGVVLRHPDVLFAAAHKPNVGLAVLRRFTMVFDPAGQRDWLIPAGSDAVTCKPTGQAGEETPSSAKPLAQG